MHTNTYSKFLCLKFRFFLSQFGFLPKKSTSDAILCLTEKLYECLNSNEISISIFVDFRKAFDSINHEILLLKLYRYGIRGPSLKLIEGYLSNRSQRVKIGDCYSSVKLVKSGIPQGSVLGPLLFIIFINDLPNISNFFSTLLFADDTTFHLKDKNLDSLISKSNICLEKFSEWSRINKMKVNIDKTFFMMTTNRTNLELGLSEVKLDGVPIVREHSAKFLGVVLDSGLKFSDHIKEISSKISKCIGIIYKLRPMLPFENLLGLYYALVNPYLEYCILVWGTTYDTHLYPLKILQKRIVRIICKEPPLSHTNPLFYKCSILKLKDMIEYRLGCYVHKNFDRFVDTSQSHGYNTRNNYEM